jgi:hypothetical protein
VTPTPQFIADNLAFLESQPFNGMAVYVADDPVSGTNVTTQLMTDAAMSYSAISTILDPIRNLPFTQLRDNFAFIIANDPPDFFDDWSTLVQNLANLARAMKEAGLRGIFFDNEQYFTPWAWYPDGVAYPQFTLDQYRAQALLRGRQVMEAMLTEFPDIVVLSLHGPYLSDPYSMQQMGFQGVFPYYELIGPFFVGFLQEAGVPGRCVDGGELYWFRGDQDFLDSYNLRRSGIASDAANSPIIPAALRPSWPGLTTIGFGVIDTPFETPFVQVDMTPAIMTATLSNALEHADRWVWLYTEGRTFLTPESAGGATKDWVDAVRAALPVTPLLARLPGRRALFLRPAGAGGPRVPPGAPVDPLAAFEVIRSPGSCVQSSSNVLGLFRVRGSRSAQDPGLRTTPGLRTGTGRRTPDS